LAIILSYSPRIGTWLFRLLIFKFIFLSGYVKLASGDTTWRDLTALTYHFQTQPLPTMLAWYAHQLPLWWHKFTTVIMYAIELVIPFFVFGPRNVRIIAASSIILLQFLILLTGNYTFFNLLTIGLMIFLLDDALLKRFMPRILTRRLKQTPIKLKSRFAIPLFAIIIIFLSTAQFARALSVPITTPVETVLRTIQPFYIASTYGLFAVMTTTRNEIIVQGSNDGQTWKEYEFKFKPSDLGQAPKWNAPHQPRLDWQMWFASLSPYQYNPWFVNFMARLLLGSDSVIALLEHNPFPNAPPKYVRAEFYEYRFTNSQVRASTGNWWHREYKGAYLPQISLENLTGVE